ncbi:phage tail spike protein [Paenibacillus sp. FSL L8-0708]|uniref:phage tail spike protein n=1 Tax=Paenibacillus sp. FSL L8-0708 TaxID=2975311 RepID=UPI0030F5B431
MPKAPVTIYDAQMRRVALLENAFNIEYSMPLNSLWTAAFSLPGDDSKNAECKPFYFVELYDNNERVELFRIVPNTMNRNQSGPVIKYECEHVLATLLNDVLFQSHTVGNLGVYTAQVIQYILSKQVVPRWKLGTVGFGRQFEYNWENDTLLGALFSVPKPFDSEYQWTWDTTSFPWTLNLVEPNEEVTAYIRYGVNMTEIEKVVDPTNLCTRLYGLGFGEGVNQLTFADINGGLPYIEDAAAQAEHGILSSIFVDRRFEYAETLLARCQTLLNELKVPRISYGVGASEIHRLTGQQIYKFKTGARIRVKDDELGEDFIARVVNVGKGDMIGAPGDVQIEIANRTEDIAGSIADLQNRQHINDSYAQGATNLDTRDFADNADPTHPAILKFYVPEETARINKVMLSFQVEAFRAYSKAIASAPSVSSGPSSTQTAGPSTRQTAGPSSRETAGPSSTETTAAGGQTTSGSSSRLTTAAGGGVINTRTGAYKLDPGFAPDPTTYDGGHNHGVANGTQLATSGGGFVTWVVHAGHTHSPAMHAHLIDLPDHTHDMNHTHEINSHTHNMEHTHDMDHTHDMSHTHNMEHTHQIPAHTHGIEYGIYSGPIPTSLQITVDGNVIPFNGTSGEEIDIIPYLSKDGSGKVERGKFHELKIAPDSLGRVVATVVSQIFVASRGGGNY